MSDTKLVQHLRATNDTNGNPRRLWVTYDTNGHTLSIEDEGYNGRPAILRDGTAVELPSVAILPTEYRRLLKAARTLLVNQ